MENNSVLTDYTAAFIVICWATFLIVWVIASLFTKRTIERLSWRYWFAPVGIVALLALLLRFDPFSILGDTFLWAQTPTVEILGALVTFLGLAILLWARFTLGGNWSSNVTFKENHELIERGPYRWVRHPIYSGLVLMVVVGAIWSGRVLGLFVLALFLIGLWYKSQLEERLLTKHFPDAYPRYKARVKALIPFVL